MKKFSSETNGYNRKEVNKFLNAIIKETEELAEKYQKQEQSIKELQKELELFKKKRLASEDDEDSNQILINAKQDASEIINDALKQAEAIEEQRKLLERNMRIFKKKLKIILEQQHIIVDKIDELEIEDK